MPLQRGISVESKVIRGQHRNSKRKDVGKAEGLWLGEDRAVWRPLLEFVLNTLEIFLPTVNPAVNSTLLLSRLTATWITQRKSLTEE